MKKTFLLAAIVSVVGLSSCKKEMTCTCTSTQTDPTGLVTTGEPSVTTYKKINKSKAKDQCLSAKLEETSTSGSSTSSYKYENKCELK
jgi:hypothetical protein